MNEVFGDLDAALFEGRLVRNVYLEWYPRNTSEEGLSTFGYTTNRGNWTIYKGFLGKRIYIGLNVSYHLLDVRYTLKVLVDTLVHEMIVGDSIRFSGLLIL